MNILCSSPCTCVCTISASSVNHLLVLGTIDQRLWKQGPQLEASCPRDNIQADSVTGVFSPVFLTLILPFLYHFSHRYAQVNFLNMVLVITVMLGNIQ
jgi:hypothetical protein